MTQFDTPVAADELRLLLQRLWRGHRIIAAAAAVATLCTIAISFLIPKTYRSEALVQPRQDYRAGSALGSMAAQFGTFADIAGLPLGGSGDRAVALATLRSRTVIEPFIQEKQLLPRLYESDWDADAKAWEMSDPDDMPTLWEAYNKFTRDILRVSDDRKTGLVLVAVEWEDPAEAQQWVTELIARTNAHLKAAAISEGEKNLAYLEHQSRSIGQVELREALYGLVETELKKLMVAKGGEEFALKTIDSAVVPKKAIRPKRLQMAILGFLFGGLTGITFVWLRPAR